MMFCGLKICVHTMDIVVKLRENPVRLRAANASDEKLPLLESIIDNQRGKHHGFSIDYWI